jgi:DNA invertase Pin-like site-specific DNA recombinase
VSAKLDRAFRSAADALATLEELKDQGVGLHLIDLGGDVIGNGVSKMVFTILAAVAEGERDRLRERIRDAKRHLASQGVFSGGSRPFGYDVVLDGEVRRLVLHRHIRVGGVETIEKWWQPIIGDGLAGQQAQLPA